VEGSLRKTAEKAVMVEEVEEVEMWRCGDVENRQSDHVFHVVGMRKHIDRLNVRYFIKI
jgi:hypothetical protein